MNPPDEAKPRVWWHWMNGNVTKEGITADLEWMKWVGIGGFQMFDGNVSTPQFVENRLVWMRPEWKGALRHAGAEADRLGLEMSMAAAGGFGQTGGPWVEPAAAMKKVVWSELELTGPSRFAGKLPSPPSSPGVFHDIPLPPPHEFLPPQEGLPGAKVTPRTEHKPLAASFYSDIKVLALPVPETAVPLTAARPKITSSIANLELGRLIDGKLDQTLSFPFAKGEQQHWIAFEFDRPWPARAFTVTAGHPIPNGRVETSVDGRNWMSLLRFGDGGLLRGNMSSHSFAQVRARYFRVVLERPAPAPAVAFDQTPKDPSIQLAEVELSVTARVHRWHQKAQFASMQEFGDTVATPSVAQDETIPSDEVIDLTDKLSPDGTLDWKIPPGRWKLLRLGYSLTGKKNGPASPEATGVEVDKLSAEHVRQYFETYTAMIREVLGPYYGKSFRYFLMDSWEAGLENWTERMVGEFKARRGYDPTSWLPALTGIVIESADLSDRFLWDFRRTLADLLADDYYGQATPDLKAQGIGLYAEAMGQLLPTTGDGLQLKGRVSVPMGEFWTLERGQSLEKTEHWGYESASIVADLKEAASAAHIYGLPVVAAESFTTYPITLKPHLPAWGQSPYDLKSFADQALALGVNRFVIHTSVHQPFVDETHKPGMTLGPFGQHYSRNITWAEQAKAWNTYLARSSYLLQQGQFVADFAYYYGEGAPVAVPFWKQVHPAAPEGYSHDWLNTEVLLQAQVREGQIVLPSGMTYRLLVLPEDVNRLTLPVVEKLRELIEAGAAVLAPRPGNSPSLAGYPAADEQIRLIANAVWGNIDGKGVTEHAFGQGKVFWGQSVAQVLASLGVSPDLEYSRPEVDTELIWTHRRAGEADTYFVASRNEQAQQVKVRFRVRGKAAEIWHPDTGKIEPAGYRFEDGHTTVPLHLDPYGSVFVVFRNQTQASRRTLPQPTIKAQIPVRGPWLVTFPPDLGAPAQANFNTLTSWTLSPQAGIKYFSGTATYHQSVDIPTEWVASGEQIVLDLGRVEEMAEVSVNGRPTGQVLWKPPFKVDLTGLLTAGQNRLQIKVTNLWPNRMIGDLQPGVTQTYTWTDFRPFTPTSPLLESGLLGPVTLSRQALE